MTLNLLSARLSCLRSDKPRKALGFKVSIRLRHRSSWLRCFSSANEFVLNLVSWFRDRFKRSRYCNPAKLRCSTFPNLLWLKLRRLRERRSSKALLWIEDILLPVKSRRSRFLKPLNIFLLTSESLLPINWNNYIIWIQWTRSLLIWQFFESSIHFTDINVIKLIWQ